MENKPITPEQQMERVNYLTEILKNLNDLAGRSKGKVTNSILMSYVVGWIHGRGGIPDPILYIATLRGGDPRTEIQDGIKLITP